MRQRKPDTETEAAPLDPIALSLALWLGLMVGAIGLQHMADQAAAQQAAQTAAGYAQFGPLPPQAHATQAR